MNKTIFVFLISFFCAFYAHAVAMVPYSTTARITIIDSVALNVAQPLFFGTTTSGVTIDARTSIINTCASAPNPIDLVTSAGNIGYIDLTGTLAGQAGTLLITLPTFLDKGFGPTQPVTLDAMFCALPASAPVHLTSGVVQAVTFQVDTANPTISNIIYVGGIVVVTAGMSPGIYIGTVNLTVTY